MGVMMTLALDDSAFDPAGSIQRLGDLIDRAERVVHLPEA